MTKNHQFLNLREIADQADLIVSGYAFTRMNKQFRVLNLNHPDHALVLSETGEVLETNMDEIEMELILDYYAKNQDYLLEVLNA